MTNATSNARLRKGYDAALRTKKSAQELRLDLSFLKQRQQADYRRLGEMLDYLTTATCRRASILRYFGERVPVGSNCGKCDLCTPASTTPSVDSPLLGALDSQDVILAAVADLQKRKMGRSGIAQVLAGSRSRKMKQLKLDDSPHYGKLTRLTQDQIIEQIDRLIGTGQLRQIPGQYPSVVLGEPVEQAGESSVEQPVEQQKGQAAKKKAPSKPTPKESTKAQTSPASSPPAPVPNPQSPFDTIPVAVGWGLLRVIKSQDGELSRSGVVHFVRGTTDMGVQPTTKTASLPGYRFLVQYSHQELLNAVDVLIERKLLVVEATEQLSLWVTQRGLAALDSVNTQQQERFAKGDTNGS